MGQNTSWPRNLPRGPHGLLGRSLSADGHHRAGVASRLAHRSLSALWDAAFDKGLVSFGDDGTVLVNPNLSEEARKALGVDHVPLLKGLRSGHQKNLAVHRVRHGL